jgi:histidinol-phosphatase (PHP family)
MSGIPSSFPFSGAACPIPADLHMHTSHSHGKAGVEAMYAAARARGLGVIGFSEHSPRPAGYAYPSDYQEKLGEGFARYVDEVRGVARLAAADGVAALLGIELDYIPGKEADAQALRDAFPFDYVIGGLHFQGSWGFDFSAGDWTSRPKEERFAIYAAYYGDLAAMCQSGLFHIAAHPDLIKLFTVESFHDWLAVDEAPRLINLALTAMKDNGMAMEISSAGLRKPCKEIYPCREIMAMAANLRLPVSFGSDAHCVDTPAFAFEALARYAGEYGYDHSVVPEKGRLRRLPFSLPRPERSP